MKPALKEEPRRLFTFPPLPYAQNALSRHISANTLSFHYGKHHQAYVTNLNKLVEGTCHWPKASLGKMSSRNRRRIPPKAGIFNNAAQVWNHTFYWNWIKPNGGGKPTGELAKKIDKDLGGYDKFVEHYSMQAGGHTVRQRLGMVGARSTAR